MRGNAALRRVTRCRFSLQHRLSSTSAAAAASSVSTLKYPEPPSANHCDLQSFLEYASSDQAGRNYVRSTVYAGTHYEYTVQSALQRLGLSLQRVGKVSDYGIDLVGTWPLPTSKVPKKVLVQCKAHAEKLHPSVARELEGAFVGAPPGWRSDGVLALLVTCGVSTKGVREALGRSRWPMGFLCCTKEGKVLQFLWNRRAEEDGLLGLEVGLRYGGSEKEEDREIVLSWRGKPFPPPERKRRKRKAV